MLAQTTLTGGGRVSGRDPTSSTSITTRTSARQRTMLAMRSRKKHRSTPTHEHLNLANRNDILSKNATKWYNYRSTCKVYEMSVKVESRSLALVS
eukprot:6212971-Pleurochrysis_carterae.AAC.1